MLLLKYVKKAHSTFRNNMHFKYKIRINLNNKIKWFDESILFTKLRGFWFLINTFDCVASKLFFLFKRDFFRNRSKFTDNERVWGV